MSSVDSRIVTMKFDNAQFESGANKTIGTLDKLKKSLALDGATKGLSDVQASANNMHFGAIEGGITSINKGFAAMATIAVTALATITQKAMAAGASVVKSLTIAPIKQGFDEYELKMGAIQTIMAGSGKSLDVVNKKLQELNEYSDKTIYSFADMTQNIGKFTNAGVDLDLAVASIKGIANAAALSGANSNEASRAMYNFSQALSSGAVRLQDWKSIELANMATKEFKQQLIDSAVAAGTLAKGADGMYTVVGNTKVALNATKNFNASLTEEWMTADVLTSTLERYSDTTTDVGKRATAAAQDVKTFSMMMDTLKETAGSGWAQTFEIIFGNFEEAKKLWTGINNAIGGMLNDMSDRRNKLLADWKELGGRDTLIDGLRKAFEGLKSIIKPITQAFREIFPATTGQQLYDLTVKFKEFAEKIKIGEETAQKLKDTFKGFFAIFSIVKQVISGAIGVILDLVGTIGKGSGGFLTITANIGKFISGIDSALKDGDKLSKFFDGLSLVLQTPIKLIQAIASYIISMFSGFSSSSGDAVNGTFDRMADRLGPLAQLFQNVQDVLTTLSDKFKAAAEVLAPFVDAVQNAFGAVGKALKETFSGADISTLLDMINTGLFAALILAVRKFLNDFKLDFGGGFVESIKETFGALTGTLQAVQQNLKANVLLKIAGAVGLLAASIVALSLIDSDKLTTAMIAIGGAFAQLIVAMAMLTKIGGMAGFVKIPIITSGMILLAGAVVILSIAIKSLAELDWKDLAKGILGTSASMVVLVAAVGPLTKASKGMFVTGLGLLGIAAAMLLMAKAVEKFSDMDLGSIAKGLGTITAALIIFSTMMSSMPKDLPYLALGLVGIAFAMNIMASAIVKMGELNIGQLVVGLVGLAGALSIIALAMGAMPENMVLTAIALVGVGIALTKIAEAVATMGAMSWNDVAKGLIVLAAALTILGIAMSAMSGSIMGAVALTAVAIALSFLAPALKALGNLSWKEILVSLVALAAALTVLGIAGYVIGPVSGFILALAASLALLGGAVALTGLGILAFAKAIEILVKLGAAAAGAIGLMLNTIVQAIPKMMQAFAEGVVNFTVTITKNAPQFAAATLTMLNAILDTINEIAPKIGATMGKLLNLMLDYVVANSPKIVHAGFVLMMAFLSEIRDNIYRIVNIAADIMTKFIKGIGDKADNLANEGARTVVKLVNAMANAIRNNSEDMQKAGQNLASAIITGFVRGITGSASGVIQAIVNMAVGAINAAKKVLGIASPSKEFTQLGKFVNQGLAEGIKGYSHIANNSVDTMSKSLLNTFKVSISDLDTLVANEMNASPIIAPVLDLTNVQKEATKIDGWLTTPNIVVDTSKTYASSIASDQQRQTPVPSEQKDILTPSQTIMFEQNNYSPKALSEVELYRQTKNQLSLAKGVLTQ